MISDLQTLEKLEIKKKKKTHTATLETGKKQALQETQEMCVQSLVWEDPLEEKMAMHPSILAWKIP